MDCNYGGNCVDFDWNFKTILTRFQQNFDLKTEILNLIGLTINSHTLKSSKLKFST